MLRSPRPSTSAKTTSSPAASPSPLRPPPPAPLRSSPPPSPRGDAKSQAEKGRWQVFPDAVVATFKPVPTVELQIESTTVDFVVNTLMQPRWWESEEKFGSTRVTLVQKQRFGRVLYLRNIKTTVGPAKVRLRLWTTQWAEQLGEGKAVVTMHAFDDLEKCHLVSRFLCTATPEGHVMVRYEEVTSSPKVAITMTHNKIKKSHVYVLQLLAAQVAKNAHLSDHTRPLDPLALASAVAFNSGGADSMSQLSNTDALMEATTTGADDVSDQESLREDKHEVEEALELVDWEELPMDTVLAAMRSPETGVLVSNRSWRLRTYKQVFVGNEAVDWLVERYPVTRDGAVLLMRELQQRGWLRHVKDDHYFKDDHLFFVWRDPTATDEGIEMVSMSARDVSEDSSSALTAAPPTPAAVVVDPPVVEVKQAAPPAPSAPASTWQQVRERVDALPLDQKALAGCVLAVWWTYSMGWMTLLMVFASGAAYFGWRVGKGSVDDELRLLKRKMAEMERRLTDAAAAGTSGVGRAPVSAIEPDRDVAKLLVRHKEAIDSVRRQMGRELDPIKHDDLFVLRFVLSFKEVPAAVEALAKCLAWRSENAELLAKVERNEPVACQAVINKHAVSEYYSKPLVDGSPMLVTRAGLCNLTGLLAEVSQHDLVDWLNWLNEFGFRECDRVTRATGRLTKLIRVNDMMNASLLQDRGFFSAVGKSSKIATFVWPQLVEKNVILNAPSLISMVIKLASTFLSPSTMSKVALCRGNTLNGSLDDCPFASRRFHRDDLPTFMGGLSSVGLCGVSNECRDMSWQKAK